MSTGRLLFYYVLVFSSQFLYAQDFHALIDSVNFHRNRQPNKAIEYGIEAINIGYQKDFSVDLLKINTLIGQLLAEQNLYGEAIRFYNESLKLFSAIPFDQRIEKEVDLPPWVLVNIGNIYFKFNELSLAEKKYMDAKKNFELYENEMAKNFGLSTVNDNLALISLKKNDFAAAAQFYDQSSSIRNQIGKPEDILYAKLGMLTLQIRQQNSIQVNRILEEIEDYYLRVKQVEVDEDKHSSYLDRNFGYALVAFGSYLMQQKNYQKALAIFYRSQEVLKYFPGEQLGISTYIAKCFFLTGKPNRALEIAKKNLQQLFSGNKNHFQQKANLELLEEIYVLQNNHQELLLIKDAQLDLYKERESLKVANKISELETYLLLSNKQEEIADNNLKYIKYIFALVILCVLLVFLFFSLRLNYNLQKIKSKEALAEKRLIQMELDNKNLALINKSNFLAQHNKNLKYILSSSQQEGTSEQLREKIKSLLKSFKVNERFEKQFEQVYPGFFQKLLLRSNSLTQNDLRLSACLRLNQNTKEIAFILGVSVRTVESQKYRLKKKLDLPKELSLVNFLHGL